MYLIYIALVARFYKMIQVNNVIFIELISKEYVYKYCDKIILIYKCNRTTKVSCIINKVNYSSQ